MVKVLILTLRTDSHARLVSACLVKKKACPIIWFPEEFLINQKGTQRIHSNGKHEITIKDENKDTINLVDVDVVWFRRPKFPILSEIINPLDYEFVETENRIHMKSIWLALGESAKWINPIASFDRANSKILQLREAAKAGLAIPSTMISNDKNSIVQFINENASIGTVYKAFSPAMWEEDEKIIAHYTSAITMQMLPDELNMSLTPGIYQEIISKAFEVRITLFSDECIGVKIHNSEKLDWRSLSPQDFKVSAIQIPLEIEDKCKFLMKTLGIVFGCFDFIVTPSDQYIFLEVNEMGQFLWIEDMLPDLHILDRFCNFLLSNVAK